MSARLLPPALAALLLVYLQAQSGIESYPAVAAAMLALAYVASALGRLLLAAAAVDQSEPCAAWCAGLLALSLALYALPLAAPVTAAGAFAAVAVAVIALEILLHRRRPALRPDWRGTAGFALCLLLTAAWCRTPAAAYEAVLDQGVLPVWSDYFFHGGLISQFGDARAFGRGSIYLADHPSSFYHFASYAAPAALAGALDQPGLQLAVATWLPLGFLAMLTGAYALGARLGAGPAGGLAALVAVAMLPDASNYGLRNGWFSFHFTLIAHAGATYALGGAFLSFAFLERWASERRRAALVAGGLLAVSVLFFRAHVFVLSLPAWLGAAAICAAPQHRRRPVRWLTMVGLFAGALTMSLVLHEAGSWRFGEPALGKFLTVVHTWQEPTAYTGVFASIMDLEVPAFTLAAGILLTVLVALGGFAVLAPAAVLLADKAGVLRPIDAACALLFFCWLLLMFLAPTPWHGDPTDLIHRPFVLLYTAIALWTLCLLLRAIGTRPDRSRALWPAVLAAAALGLPWLFATAPGMASPKFRWGEFDAAVRVPPGLVQAAAFLRRHAAAGDLYAAAGLHGRYATFDLSTQLCALSGMPAYLSRPYFETIKDGPRKALVHKRLAALEAVAEAADHANAMRALRSLGVQWYVIAGHPAPRWDPGLEHAAFRSGAVALYAAEARPSGEALHDEVRVGNAH